MKFQNVLIVTCATILAEIANAALRGAVQTNDLGRARRLPWEDPWKMNMDDPRNLGELESNGRRLQPPTEPWKMNMNMGGLRNLGKLEANARLLQPPMGPDSTDKKEDKKKKKRHLEKTLPHPAMQMKPSEIP